MSSNRSKRRRIKTNFYSKNNDIIIPNNTTGRQKKRKAETLAKEAHDIGNEVEVKKIMNNEFKRKTNNVGKFYNNFSKESIEDAEDEVYGMGNYSDDESKKSIHYEPGHNVNYYEEDGIKRKIRNIKSKTIIIKSQETFQSVSDDDFESKGKKSIYKKNRTTPKKKKKKLLLAISTSMKSVMMIH